MSPYPVDAPSASGPMRIVLVAAPEREVESLVSQALERRLAACASTVPIRSTYWWQGSVERAEEVLVLFKTVPKRVGALFRLLAENHSYEVPEILEIDVPRVHGPYLRYLTSTIDPDALPPPLGGGAGGPVRRSGSRRGRGAQLPARTRAQRRRP